MFRGIRGAFARFSAADGFFLGAGVAFFFLVCVIPLTMLLVSAMGFVLSSERAATQVVNQLVQNFPVYKREIASTMLRIVETRKESGVLGTVVLVFFSTQLFSASRLAMHRLIGIRPSGQFLSNLALDAGMVVVLSVFLFLATFTTWALHWINAFVLAPAGLMLGGWAETANVALSLAVSVAMFYLGYRYVPRRHIRISAALRGAVLASLLWEVAKQLFRLYIRRVGVYDQIYGPMGVLVAFVMFIYYSSIVFVFGGAYAAALDSRRR